MPGLLRNLRYTFRTFLRTSPGLTLTVLLTLVLGIGANTAIFTVDYATLLAPAPYPDPDRLVMVWSKLQGHRTWVSAADFIDWKRQSRAFEDINAWGQDDFNVATADRPEFIEGMVATPGYCRMLGNPLFLGRNFLPEEGEPGKDHVVILTHRLWQHLGGNLKIIGQAMRINGERYTVVGVMAPGTADRREEELIVPLVFKPEQLKRDARSFVVTGRLKRGITLPQAQADMDVTADRLANDYPKTNNGIGALVEPFKNDFLPGSRQLTLWLLLGAVGFLLLIACLNVANLLLAKGITRQREVAIRNSLGAGRTAIFTQFLTESLVLAILGGLLGVAAGYAMLRSLVAAMPPHVLPPEADLRLNIPVLLFMLAAATLAGVLSGCAPAWCASRLDPAEFLKDGGHSGIRAGRHRLRILVIAEFALALPLLAGAGLALRSFWNLAHVDLGVRTDHTLGFYLEPPSLLKNPRQTNPYYSRMLANVEAVPGVTRACAMAFLPLEGLHISTPFTLAGQAGSADPSRRPRADLQNVTPAYFQTFGIRIVKGRSFTDADQPSSARVAMVNEAFANTFLKGVDPLRQRIMLSQRNSDGGDGPLVEWQIVGVFHTVKSRGFREDPPEIDTPFWQMGFPIAGIGVRTAQDPAAMIRSIAAAVNSVDIETAIYKPRTMDQVRDEVLVNDRFTAILFAAFAGIALLLTTVGVYSVMAFTVTRRSRELAVRMALGATRSRLVARVVAEGAVLACAGLGFGSVGVYFVGRAMQSILFDVKAVSLSVFGAVGLLLLLAALIASWLPAFRAASVETMQVLRRE